MTSNELEEKDERQKKLEEIDEHIAIIMPIITRGK